ncbi:outer membrane protein [Desulforegula conservatrix]|uniref:outer membrane protein n=1 Tax=Desulforegula conservatrix TaxID=153026 RepID=UPI0003FD91FB|nr:outer membrane beta-barrel protein [Desulforegula conservatrix]
MKTINKLIGLSILTAALFISSPVFALEWKGGVDFMFGKKELDSDWTPVDSWQEFGVMLSFTEADLPFGITLGYLTGNDDSLSVSEGRGINIEGQTDEFLLGLRKEFSPPQADFFRVYINGGYTAIKWDIETTYSNAGAVSGSTEEDDWAHGFWLGGGMYFIFAKNAAIGIDYKYTDASSDINTAFGERTLEAGGSHYSAFVGWRF